MSRRQKKKAPAVEEVSVPEAETKTEYIYEDKDRRLRSTAAYYL